MVVIKTSDQILKASKTKTNFLMEIRVMHQHLGKQKVKKIATTLKDDSIRGWITQFYTFTLSFWYFWFETKIDVVELLVELSSPCLTSRGIYLFLVNHMVQKLRHPNACIGITFLVQESNEHLKRAALPKCNQLTYQLFYSRYNFDRTLCLFCSSYVIKNLLISFY